ncbi:MAG: molybdenum cofactor guanylyltransferase MobA [Sulfurimonas sp.]|nr:molybdenum cofactor guanylyltransferase MobA [Sulfurimonas sp.]
MIETPCVIFAGGKSSRMGEDKSLLPFGDFKTLTQFQLSRLSKIFKTVYISCKSKDKFTFDANFIEDVLADSVFAPTAGFVAVFKELQDESFFALSVDAPFISEEIIVKLLEEDAKNMNVDATIATSSYGIEPMCGIYHRSLESGFVSMLETNNHKLGFLLKKANTIFVPFEDAQPFLNLNSPDDYKEALKLI